MDLIKIWKMAHFKEKRFIFQNQPDNRCLFFVSSVILMKMHRSFQKNQHCSQTMKLSNSALPLEDSWCHYLSFGTKYSTVRCPYTFLEPFENQALESIQAKMAAIVWTESHFVWKQCCLFASETYSKLLFHINQHSKHNKWRSNIILIPSCCFLS